MSVPYRSVFAQLLQFVPRDAFDALARKHRHEAHSKGFPSHTQFVAMLFMQGGAAGQRNRAEWAESALRPSTLQRESPPHHQVPLDSSFYTTPKQGVGDEVK